MGMFDPGTGAIAGALIGAPELPSFNRLDPQEMQRQAIQGNLGSMAENKQLASSVNLFNQQQIDQMLQRVLPQYNQIKGQASGVVSGMLKNDADFAAGKIPKDLTDRVQNSAAARALGGGFGGSSAHGDLVARDLGLTSLDLMNMAGKGLSAAESWLKTVDSMYQPGQFNLQSMFLTPQQQFGMKTQERNAEFQHDWVQNQLDWQTSPGYLIGNEIQQDSAQGNQMIGSVVGSVAGKAAGGGGGGM